MKIWRIYETTFEAAHLIIGHPTCGNLHGHSYRVKVSVEGRSDLFIDFHLLSDMVDGLVSKWDHTNLGAKTCEELAVELLSHLAKAWKNDVHTNFRVRIKETDKFGVQVTTETS